MDQIVGSRDGIGIFESILPGGCAAPCERSPSASRRSGHHSRSRCGARTQRAMNSTGWSRMLGRTPTFTELGIISALWSEHCSYKHSRPLLRTLPTKAPYVLQGPGENAGVISIGDGLAVAFKIESHNHPSAVEPYQGAATGVGGILRDVFTMGARPIAMLNSLRFGSLESARVRYLFSGVVKGIGDYGNCVGIPTVAGEIVFDPAYERQPARQRDVCRPDARRGSDSRQGRGRGQSHHRGRRAHGSRRDSRSIVRVGRPVRGKRCEAAASPGRRPVHREAPAGGESRADHSGHIVAIQDMGAAGLTSSSAEMAERGDVGVIDRRYESSGRARRE